MATKRPRGLRLSYAGLRSARATIRNYTTLWDTAPDPKIVFDKGKIGDHHMWVDKNLRGTPAVVSNALGERLAQSDIFGLSVVQREEA